MEVRQLAKEIETIARRAGDLITQNKISNVAEKTQASDIVTDLDIKAQELILKACLELLPQSEYVAEEDTHKAIGEEYTWVIDPIDGTTNFAYDFHHSCISIALLYQRKGLIGVVYNPFLNECFVGIENEGSYLNGKRIHASQNDLKHAISVVGTAPYYKEYADVVFDNMKKLFLAGRDVRRTGSAALDCCYVACGRVDVYYEERLSPWDYAAGLIIMKNAQACAKALHGEFDYLSPVGIIAANETCFEEVCALLGVNHE